MKKMVLEKEYMAALAAGVDALKKGGLVVFPTDTVYGLGCDASNEKAIAKIYSIKGREERKPLAVIMGNFGMIDEWCDLSEKQASQIMGMLPGPYTFIVNLRKGKTLAGLSGKIGIRVPEHMFVRKLAQHLGFPIAATSANLSGETDAFRLKDVDTGMMEAADLAIDGGETMHRKSSTVVDLVDRKILRKGAGKFEFK